MLCRHHGALDDEQIELCLGDVLRKLLNSARSQGRSCGGACLFYLGNTLDDERLFDRLAIDLLQTGRGFVFRKLRDLLEHAVRVVVTRPETFEVQHAYAAKATHLDCCGRACNAVHGRRKYRQLERVCIDLPTDVDILWV